MLRNQLPVNLTPKLYSDSLEFMPVYIAYMRAHEDMHTVPDMLSRFNAQMSVNKGISVDQFRQLAVYAADKIYRFAAELDVRDGYTVMYMKKVVAELIQLLQHKGIKTFYVIDNEIREDRFDLMAMLYSLSGTAVVTPYEGQRLLSFTEVEKKLKDYVSQDKPIVYIEKNASVNYIGQVMHLAAGTDDYIGIFRNLSAHSNYVEVI